MVQLHVDHRLGGTPRYYLAEKSDNYMYVPEEIHKCVVFVACHNGFDYTPLGTAFFVSIEAEGFGRRFVYLITAKHVIVAAKRHGDGQHVHLRVNMASGEARYLISNISDWRYHEDDTSIDVAVLNWNVPATVVDFVSLQHTMCATDEVIQQQTIGIGDEVFLTGLFVNHHGKNRNLPIVRVGNIALMPKEKIATRDFGSIEAYLVEARSIGGLSGSPVFVHLAPFRVIDGQIRQSKKQYYWLGLMHGHWQMPVSKTDTDELKIDTLEGEKLNMGIAIVVPATNVMDVLNQPYFVAGREDALRRLEQERAPTPDTLPDADSAIIETEDGAFTEADFEEALRKVSKRKAKEDKGKGKKSK